MKSNNLLAKILVEIPFSYLWLHKKAIGEAKTILDLGCGRGEFMSQLASGEEWKIVGIELFKKDAKEALKTGIYEQVLIGDLEKNCEKLITNKKKYDVCICSQVIEHLKPKKGEKIISLAQKLAKKRVIFTTPRGFMHQPHEFLGDNPHQVHLSGWSLNDFSSQGYKLFGMGFMPVWSEHGWGRSASPLQRKISTVISYIFSPLVYYFPILGSGMLAIKEIKRK